MSSKFPKPQSTKLPVTKPEIRNQSKSCVQIDTNDAQYTMYVARFTGYSLKLIYIFNVYTISICR